jgi:PAS domain S-box-containing protein
MRKKTGKPTSANRETRRLQAEVEALRAELGEVRGTAEARASLEALRQSEEHFRTLADAITTLAWWANADGYLTWYNRRWYEYTGTTPQQMEGWGWQSVHDPQVLPEVMARWQASIATGEPFDMTFPLRGADGPVPPVSDPRPAAEER